MSNLTIARVIYRNGEFEQLTGRSVGDVERKLSTRQPAHVIGWNSGDGGDTKYQRMRTVSERRKLLASLNHLECKLRKIYAVWKLNGGRVR